MNIFTDISFVTAAFFILPTTTLSATRKSVK